ncbi:MAG TPA: DNA methyltransferase, partial [Stellaceae bacterium]|nr:DNA methyltransferase [Stellaceae bacterium]
MADRFRSGESATVREGFVGPWKLDTTHNTECLSGLRQIPDDSFDLAVTSPPYWGQRGNAGIGSEPDPRDYVRNLVTILAEVMRCLKPSGTLWLNIGDAYNTPINWRTEDYGYSSLGKEGHGLPLTNSAYTKKRGRRRAFINRDVGWLRYGNLLGIPYRIVLAMTDLNFLFRGYCPGSVSGYSSRRSAIRCMGSLVRVWRRSQPCFLAVESSERMTANS